MELRLTETGSCGAACKLCPRYYIKGQDKCPGCNTLQHSESCPLIECIRGRKDTQSCWNCPDREDCQKWLTRTPCSAIAEKQNITRNVAFIREYGIEAFERLIKTRCNLLREMLETYDDGTSGDEYCHIANMLGINELQAALTQAWIECEGLSKQEKSAFLLSLLDKNQKSKKPRHRV